MDSGAKDGTNLCEMVKSGARFCLVIPPGLTLPPVGVEHQAAQTPNTPRKTGTGGMWIKEFAKHLKLGAFHQACAPGQFEERASLQRFEDQTPRNKSVRTLAMHIIQKLTFKCSPKVEDRALRLLASPDDALVAKENGP